MSPNAAELVVQFQSQIVQTVILTMPVLTIGRTPDNGLSLPHPLVGRRHAELSLESGVAVLTDLGSSTGTLVGGERILSDQPRQLADGDVVQIGPFTLHYRAMRTEEQIRAAEQEPEPGPELAEPEPALVEDGDLRLAEVLAAQPVEPIAVLRAAEPPAPPRPRCPAPRATGPASRYLLDLPVIYHDSDFLGRFLQIFESIWEPLEQRQDHIEMYFDPRTCPVHFLPWLASWLGLSLDVHWPESRQRVLMTELLDLYRWRGTRYGLTRMIELCTGLMPTISEEPDQPFVMRVRMPRPNGNGVDRALIEDLIRAHKPAHIGYILEFVS